MCSTGIRRGLSVCGIPLSTWELSSPLSDAPLALASCSMAIMVGVVQGRVPVVVRKGSGLALAGMDIGKG
eukprot:5757364-Heterocapsa_arctica.AAC.1